MSTTDCRTLHIYRVPVHQKRTLALENYASISPLRLPSPNRVKFASGRRHSTPQTSAKLNSIDFQPQSHITNKDSNLSSDAAKPPSRPVSLVKLRPSEERLTRLVTTPTSIHSFTDVILPIAKKNRNTFIETSNPIPSDTQFKRTKATSNDLETRTIVSSEDNVKRLIRLLLFLSNKTILFVFLFRQRKAKVED